MAAEKAARAYLSLIRNLPDVFSVYWYAEQTGYAPFVDHTAPKGFLGKAPDEDGEIWLGPLTDERQLNEVLAHEIGHHHLKRQQYGLLEFGCDHFGSCIQLPEEPFRQAALDLAFDVQQLARRWPHVPIEIITRRIPQVFPNAISGLWSAYNPDWREGPLEYHLWDDLYRLEEDTLAGAYTMHYPYYEQSWRGMKTRAWCLKTSSEHRGITLSTVRPRLNLRLPAAR